MNIEVVFPHPGQPGDQTRLPATPEKLDELIAAGTGYKLEENGEVLDEWHPSLTYQIRALE